MLSNESKKSSQESPQYFLPQAVQTDVKLSKDERAALQTKSKHVRINDLENDIIEYIALTAEGLGSLKAAGISGFNPIIPNGSALITLSKKNIKPEEEAKVFARCSYSRTRINNEGHIVHGLDNSSRQVGALWNKRVKTVLNDCVNILFPGAFRPDNFDKAEMQKALYEMANDNGSLWCDAMLPSIMLNQSAFNFSGIKNKSFATIYRVENTIEYISSNPCVLMKGDDDKDELENKAVFTWVTKYTAVFNEQGKLTGYDQSCSFYPHNADAIEFLLDSFEKSTPLAKILVEKGFEKSTSTSSSADRRINSLVKHRNKILAGLFVLFVAALTLAALALFVVFTAPASVPALIVTVIAAFSVKALIGTLAATAIAGITAGLVALFAGVSAYLMPKKISGINADHSIEVRKLQPEDKAVAVNSPSATPKPNGEDTPAPKMATGVNHQLSQEETTQSVADSNHDTENQNMHGSNANTLFSKGAKDRTPSKTEGDKTNTPSPKSTP